MNDEDRYYGERAAAIYDEPMDIFEPGAVDATVEVLARLAGGGRALEMGIDTGRIVLPLARRGVTVHGIELSRAMVFEELTGISLPVWPRPAEQGPTPAAKDHLPPQPFPPRREPRTFPRGERPTSSSSREASAGPTLNDQEPKPVEAKFAHDHPEIPAPHRCSLLTTSQVDGLRVIKIRRILHPL